MKCVTFELLDFDDLQLIIIMNIIIIVYFEFEHSYFLYKDFPSGLAKLGRLLLLSCWWISCVETLASQRETLVGDMLVNNLLWISLLTMGILGEVRIFIKVQ